MLRRMLMAANAGGAPTTWSTTRKGSGVLLSNGNMDAEQPGSPGVWRSVLGTTQRSSGKYQFEVYCVAAPAGNQLAGVAGPSWFASGSLDTYIGSSNDSTGYAINTVYHSGLGGYTPSGSFTAWGPGTTLTVAIDFTAKTIRYYVNGAGNYVDTYSASLPALCPAVSVNDLGKMRLRVASLAYPVSGYTDWG